MTESTTCERAFKYVDASGAEKILDSRTLIWRSPLTFNDPFDVRTDLNIGIDKHELALRLADRVQQAVFDSAEPISHFSLVAQKLITKLRQDRHSKSDALICQDIVKNFNAMVSKSDGPFPRHKWIEWLQRARVLCLSEVPDHLLMWSHYSDHHRGVVIEFQPVSEIDSALCAGQRVKYANKVPVFATTDDWLGYILKDVKLIGDDTPNRMLWTKATCWSYEQEWRVMTKRGQDDPPDISFVPFDPREVASIRFGCRCEEATITRVIELLDDDFAHVDLYQMVAEADKFALSEKPIPKSNALASK